MTNSPTSYQMVKRRRLGLSGQSLDLEIAHLAEATQRIAEGEERILRQQALIEELRSQGPRVGDLTRNAESLLALFRATLAGWMAYRDLIEDAIARLDQVSPSVGEP